MYIIIIIVYLTVKTKPHVPLHLCLLSASLGSDLLRRQPQVLLILVFLNLSKTLRSLEE
jgi:hypothetical protein